MTTNRRNWKKISKSDVEKKYLSGKQYHYLICPCCGMNKPLNRYRSGQAYFVDVDNHLIIQTREQSSGRGSGGFFSVGGKTLKQLKDDPEFEDIVSDIKNQCNKILKILK